MILEISEKQYDALFNQLTSGHTTTTYDTTTDSSLLAIHQGSSVAIAKHLATEPPTHWLLNNDEHHHYTTVEDVRDHIAFTLATRTAVARARTT